MKPMKYVSKISCKRKNPTNEQHRKNDITNKWQKLLSGTVITGSLLVCLLCQTERFPDTDVPKREYRLTGTSLQSVKHVTSYTGGCNTIYDDTLYEGETIVAEEGASGKQETTTLVTYLNGRAVSEDIIDTRTITPATTREVRVGTKKRPEFLAPVEGYVITSYVGPRWGRSHNGLDLAVPVGTPVSNSAAGTVIQSGWNGGYGISVYVDCGDGVIIRYGHLSEVYVEVGQTVSQGETLGLSGNTGNSTGPHLHFEMRIQDEVVDPLDYMDL